MILFLFFPQNRRFIQLPEEKGIVARLIIIILKKHIVLKCRTGSVVPITSINFCWNHSSHFFLPREFVSVQNRCYNKTQKQSPYSALRETRKTGSHIKAYAPESAVIALWSWCSLACLILKSARILLQMTVVHPPCACTLTSPDSLVSSQPV